MEAGNIILTAMPQADGIIKLRPALVLKLLPKYKDCLVCGISTQLHQELQGIDHVIERIDDCFRATGLRQTSVIRLLYLGVINDSIISGLLGYIPEDLHRKLLARLSGFLLT